MTDPIHPESASQHPNSSSYSTEILDDGSTLVIRKPDADGNSDPFVEVSIYDAPDVGHPYSRFTAYGPNAYSDYERHGRSAVAHSGVLGVFTKVELETALTADPTQRLKVAEQLATVIFGLDKTNS